MSVHVFCGGMDDDVGSPFERSAVDGCGERVVHEKGHAVTVGDASELLNVEHIAAGI